MKKILLLGGSAQQVIAIKTAKELGYYTVLCDFLDDNPGQFVADKFYLVSTTDKEAILEVAKKEKIDGILAYASDPAAPTAAYVAEVLDLPGNPYKSVDILCNKDKFREFLKEHHFNVPKAHGYTNVEVAEQDVLNGSYSLPIIIKPTDSSGSKGITVLRNKDNLRKAIEFAFSYSRNKHIIIEEFIEKDHKYLVGGDIFVKDGEVVIWGLLNCYRDQEVNPLVPTGKSYPLDIEKEKETAIKETLSRLIKELDIKDVEMNVELIVDSNNKVYPIDIGPRAGGNMIPDLLNYIFDVDVIKMAILSAMGEKYEVKTKERNVYFATHNLHVKEDGVFNGIEFKEPLKSKIIKECIYKKKGDSINRFSKSVDAIGIIFMKFESLDEEKKALDQIKNYIVM